jgi:hypothetical protein
LVTPIFYATVHPIWLPPVLVAQTLLAVGLMWGLRSLLWFGPWAEAERALPLPAGELRRSDSVVVSLALAPLAGVCVLGAITFWSNDPPWLQGFRGWALGVLALWLLASVVLSVLLLQFLRRPLIADATARRALRALQRDLTGASIKAWQLPSMPMIQALLLLPLCRGPARRAGFGLCGSGVILCIAVLGLWLLPQAASWWLAAFAALSLTLTTRVHGLARDALEPLWMACTMLPLSVNRLRRWRAGVVLLAPLSCGFLLWTVLPVEGVRWLVFTAYGGVLVLGHVLIVCNLPGRPSTVASRWLFFAAVAVALATEVMA